MKDVDENPEEFLRALGRGWCNGSMVKLRNKETGEEAIII